MKIKLFVVAVLLLFSVGSVDAVTYIDTPTVDSYQLNIIGEKYILLNNTTATDTAFVISADDIIFDGSGYNVTYANTSTGYGIYANGYNNITVINTGFKQSNSGIGADAVGIRFSISNNNHIMNNTIITSSTYADDIYLYLCQYNTISNNTLTTTGSGYGTGFNECYHNLYSGNTILTTDVIDGIVIFQGSDNTITLNNMITGGHGIRIDESDNNVLTNNSIISTGVNKNAIYLDEAAVTTIQNGSIMSMLGNDYALYNSDQTNVFRNTNFTDTREIYFYDVISVFKYSNFLSNDVYISTNLTSGGKSINRTISEWNDTSLLFSDEANATTNGVYSVSGIQNDIYYKVTTTPNVYQGYILNGGTFTIPLSIGVNTEINITKKNVPSVPIPINPSYNSNVVSEQLILSASSTDADNDNVSYLFYGDTVDGSTLINISTTGNYTWNIDNYGVYYWRVKAYDGYDYSANTSLQFFTYVPPPDLQTPTNTSTHTYSYPPLMHDLTFAWQDISTPAYKYQVATDENFNLISEEDTITSNTTTLSLEADDYFWRVYAYETDTGTYSNASDVWQFTINETDGGASITAIDGVVYEITTAGSVAVDGALVNIWNNTWSDSMLVGQNGYYYFDGAKSGTYSVRATKTGYTDSSIELVTVTALNTTTRNILLQSTSGAGQQYVDHYVKFTLKSLFGTLYSGVTTNVYLNGAVIATYTGTTGTDGAVAFELDENQEYRITFVKVSPAINQEITLYPKEDAYTVYVELGTMIDDLLNPDDEDQEITAIEVSVTKTIIDTNTANITVNYNDIMDETTNLTIELSQSIDGNTTNKTVLATASLGTTNNTAYDITVTNYNGESYFITITATHTTHGEISRLYGVEFENTATKFGFAGEVVGWLAIIFLIWFALTATQATVPHTAIGVCALATVLMALGWGQYISVPGLALAWIMSLAANFAAGKEASA